MTTAINTKINLIIPCAKMVSVEMQNEFGQIPPGIVPLTGKIAIERIMESYGDQLLCAYIGIQEGADLVENYFSFFPNKRVKLVNLKNSVSLSDTIEQIIASHPSLLNAPIVINLADTIVDDLDQKLLNTNFICYAHTIETERWTLFKFDKLKINEISDKKYQPDNEAWRAFVGVWGFREPKIFFNLLKLANLENKLNAFYTCIMTYVNNIGEIELFETQHWIDCGHVDNYYSARRHKIAPRFFNQVQFNNGVETISKRGSNTKKIINEINWFLSLPKELHYYTPNIYDYSCDPHNPYIEMEFYSYPTLDECLVYARYDFDSWEKIFHKIFSIIKIASKYTVKDDNLITDLKIMYVQKTLHRLNEFIKDGSPINLEASQSIVSNGQTLLPLSHLVLNLEELIKTSSLCHVADFQIIHGDPCFSNILYDNKHGILKLIDPRGCFGRFTIYGDVYYDLAKLSHSVLGFYDFIKLDQYKLECKKNNHFDIRWRTIESHNTIGRIFIKHLEANGYDLRRVRLLEALLFLSMLPLHKDRPDHQIVMLLQGMSILSKVTENNNL